MSDPTAEHVDAVARAILSTTPHHEGDDSVWETCGTDARAVLTSTDPAVHAAMLDALVRAGVLEPNEEFGVRREWGDVGSVAPIRNHSEEVTVAKAWEGTVMSRRHYVTRGEVSP